MKLPNLETVLFILGINILISGVLLFYIKKDNELNKYIKHWGLGSIFTGIGLIIYSFFPLNTTFWIDFLFSFSFPTVLSLYISQVLLARALP